MVKVLNNIKQGQADRKTDTSQRQTVQGILNNQGPGKLQAARNPKPLKSTSLPH